MDTATALTVGVGIGLFVGVWATYFARKFIWGFDPNEVSRARGLRR